MSGVGREDLKRIPLFRDLEPAEVDAIAAMAHVRRCAPREVVVTEEVPAQGLYLLTRGRAAVSVAGKDGSPVTIGELGVGEIIGEISLLDGGTASATVTAMTPLELIAIDRAGFLRLLEGHPKMAIPLLGVLARRLRRLTRWADDLAALPVPSRLAKCLMALVAEHGQQVGPRRIRLGIKLSQHDLGMRIGVTRESINKHVRRWEQAGILQKESGHLVVADLEQLRSLADG
ncbi:MAG TPA: Crp/Fnr family transcriptional regulator [Polyangia bacterium]|nr:Crp/Fnr family transcriptional regulator [Polyangia bacterium]